MQLVEPKTQHLLKLMQWFSSESELRSWAGPNFTYPYNEHSFAQDLKIDSLTSFSLISNEGDLYGFGQCYQRLKRCHLGRLVVSPEHRGIGISTILIDLLSAFGMQEFEVHECSLFVYPDNSLAVKAYLKYGFEFAKYPEKIPMDNCLYMVKRCHT